MRLTSPRLWIIFFSLTAVFYLALVDFKRTSPGPLTNVHEREPELAGNRSCAACHGGWFGNMTDSCLACHDPIARQIESTKGLHGALGKEKAARCAFCHSEHHGGDFAMVNRQSFVQAGAQGREGFKHDAIGYAMAGRHLVLECSKCHAHADTVDLPKGARRFIGLEQECSTCHHDPHEGRMGFTCATCHVQEGFEQAGFVGHEKHLPLIGGHGGPTCRTCHAKEDTHALEALASARRPAARTCADCHASPHRASFVAGVARIAPPPRRDAAKVCAECHAAEHTSFVDRRLVVTPAQHAVSGYALDAPHDKVICADCHPPERGDFMARYPGREQDRCSTCHADPHGGQFAGGPFGDGGCIGCHDRQHFKPPAFGVREHQRTALELTGRHLEIECHTCHEVPVAGAPRTFRGTSSTDGSRGQCVGCHADAHDQFFDRFAADLATTKNGSCARCHVTTKFAQLPVGGFDHGRWTGFALQGAHQTAVCEACHARRAESDARRRTFGRVTEQFGAVSDEGRACVPCHHDPHEGGFDRPELPASVDGRIGCARCHAQVSFRSFPEKFDHGRWTGYAMEGAHRKLGCASCHEPLREPDAVGRTWGRARGRLCADCHADPHAGQFRAEKTGVTECQRCHRTEPSFKELAFDHERQARFALGEAHKGLPCAVCHKKVRKGDVEVVHHRPIAHECRDCHGENEEPLRRRARRKS